MENIIDKIEYLDTTKQMLKQVIQDKGQEMTDETPFRNYVDKVQAIEHRFEHMPDYFICLEKTRNILEGVE